MQSIPAVAVVAGGVGEVVINDETGILLPLHDAVAFSKAVISLMENNSLRKTLGENARKFVEDRYSLQQCLKQFEILYADILKEKQQSGR